jgi:hypothetical protein
VGDYGPSRPNRANFPGVVTDCNDEIKVIILKFIHELAAGIGDIYLEVVPGSPAVREENFRPFGLRLRRYRNKGTQVPYRIEKTLSPVLARAPEPVGQL